ncbi:MAG: hypothetical protein D6718_12200 [Acidobacteria bacterium]|nr:MAG: hypothetical protein D6718_12200 [Acidobacteriota bacterium]
MQAPPLDGRPLALKRRPLERNGMRAGTAWAAAASAGAVWWFVSAALVRSALPGSIPLSTFLLAVPVLLVAGAVRRTRRWWRLGDVEIEPLVRPEADRPVLEVFVRTGLRSRPVEEIEVSLSLIEEKLAAPRRRPGVLWQEVRWISPMALSWGHRGYDVPVRIPLPAEPLPAPGGPRRWRLELIVPGRRERLRTAFDLGGPLAGATGVSDGLTSGTAGIEVVLDGDGRLRVTAAPFRHGRPAAAAAVAGAVLLAAGAAALGLSGSLLLAAPAFGIGLVLVAGAFDIALRASAVEVDRLGLRARVGWLGSGRAVEVPKDRIRDIRPEPRGRRDLPRPLLFDIVLHLDGGERVVLVDRVVGAEQARDLARRMAVALGR